MYNEFGKKPKFTLVTVIAVAAAMLVAATTEKAITGYAFAYNRNQATGAANDCGNGQVSTNIGCQNTDSQIQGDENSVALTSQQTFPSVTSEPSPTGFSVTGTGESQLFFCGENMEGTNGELEFSAEGGSDGTVTGTFNLQALRDNGVMVNVDGIFTAGTTDGNTFTLNGVLPFGQFICLPEPEPIFLTISGDCGDDVTVTYEDIDASAQFIADVEGTLT
jgi:hypothetical protein